MFTQFGSQIFLHYDEKSIKSMGADGYHFLFTQGDDTIEILVTQKETPNYMDYAFSGSGLY